MDKMDTISSLTHAITLNERKNIIITGVKKIDSFDEEEFYLETTMGDLIIKGEEDLDKYTEIVENGINSLNNQIEFR